MSTQTKATSKETEKHVPFAILFPIIAVLAVIPLITYMYKYNTKLDSFEWYTAATTAVDFFLYYKMFFIIVTACYMVCCIVYMVLNEYYSTVWIKSLIPLAIYAVITFISACASKNSYFSFHGIYEQFEPVWVLLGYCVFVYYSFFLLRSETNVKRVMKWFVIGVCVMTALGLSQVFSHDFFRTDLGKSLIIPSNLRDTIDFKFELGRAYLTLYNPNYIGFYVTMIVPVLTALIITAKKLWQRILYAFLIVSLILILFSSQSRAGIITIIISLAIMLLCMRKMLAKYWKAVVAAIAVFIVAFIGVNVMNQNVLLDRMKSMFSVEPEVHPLENIITNDDNVAVTYNGNTVYFSTSLDDSGNDVFTITDSDKNELASTFNEENGTYTINDERFPFSYGSIRVESFSGFVITIDGKQWYFSNLMKQKDSTYYALGGGGALMKYTEQEKSLKFLEEHFHFANMRGYIWARTLPLIKKYFFLGSGPDTFIIAFPSNDIVGMYNSGHDGEIVTKPHCMYMQIAVQTGVPSLIALLVFFIWYMADCLKIYWKNTYKSYLSVIGVSIFVSVIGYLILALTNDSCVATAPIFYGLIGMGLGINWKLKKDAKEAQNVTVE